MTDIASPIGLEPGLREPTDIEVITEPSPGPRLARQPLAGIAGLAVVAGLVALLGIAPGRPQTALQVSIPLATFALPVLVMMALWWERWPTDRLSRPLSGLLNTLLLAGGTFALAALASSCVVGLVVYGLLAHWNAIPAGARSLVSLRNPDGPMDAVDIVGLLVCIVIWQVTCYLLLGGWPFNTIRNTGTRLFVANVGVLGGGALTYMFLHNVLGWSIPVIGGVGGSIVAGVVLAALLFEAWPFRSESPAAGALGLLVAVGAVALAVFWGLKALGNGIQDWNQGYPV